jgi:recombination protein RecA
MSTAINETIKNLNKAMGRTVVMSGDDLPPPFRIRTKIPAVDYVSGGGVPGNRIIELLGDPSAGKSFLAYSIIREFQSVDWGTHTQGVITKVDYAEKKIRAARGSEDDEDAVYYEVSKLHTNSRIKNPIHKRVALVDYENSFDTKWAKQIGIDTKGLLVVQPQTGSEAVNIVETLLKDPSISLVVLDSVGAIGSDAEIESAQEDNQMAANARFWNKAMRKFSAAVNCNPEKDITFLFINRHYEKVGLVFGDPKVVSNGSGLKFGKHLSIFLKAKGAPQKAKINEKQVVIGRTVEAEAIKNKTARPFLTAEYYFSFVDDGIYKVGETDVLAQVVDIGLSTSVIIRSGTSYSWGDYKAVGKEKFLALLEKNSVQSELEEEIWAVAFKN